MSQNAVSPLHSLLLYADHCPAAPHTLAFAHLLHDSTSTTSMTSMTSTDFEINLAELAEVEKEWSY